MTKSILQSIAIFMIISLLLLTVERSLILLFILDFKQYNINQIASLYYMGARFDLKVISSLVLIFYFLPALISLIIFKNKTKTIKYLNFILILIFLFELLISLTGYGFYHFFGNHIDQLALGIIDDGFINVVKSMLVNPLVINLTIILLITTVISLLIFFKINNNIKANITNKKKLILTMVLLFILLFAFSRGSFSTFPLSRKTNQANNDYTLNSLALNSIMNLYYAYKDNKKDIYDFSINKLLKKYSVKNFKELKQKAGYNQDNPLVKTTSKKILPPPNIIFILMEGWSSHIALSHSNDNNVLGEFNQHKSQDYFFNNFFSNSYGTNPTIERLILNSPISPLSLSKAKKTTIQTSNILTLKKSGYSTEFISGGNRSWRNIGDFHLLQGFDKFFDRSNIENKINNKSNNPWGVFEEDLFKFTKQRIQTQNKPFFTFVLTTNNHPPVVLPTNYKSPKFNLKKFNTEYNKKIKTMLDGYYYQSNELGKFISWFKLSKFAKNTIIVATGDHILKGFDNYNKTAMGYYKYAVPLYLYIPEKYRQDLDTKTIGSHLDIFPTLFDLSLSEKNYFSFGSSLINKNNNYGWTANGGYNVIFPQGIANNSGINKWQKIIKLINKNIDELSEKQKKILQQLPYQEAVAKYLIFKSFNKK